MLCTLSSQLWSLSGTRVFMMARIERFSRSVRPFDCGRYGKMWMCFTWKMLQSCCITPFMNSGPLSDKTSMGVSCLSMMCSVKALAMVSAFLSGSGINSVYLEKLSTHARMYLLPLCVVTNPDKMSMDTR